MQRKKKYAVRLRASRGEKSLLEAASVKAPQRKDYARRLEQFYAFVLRYELPIQSEVQLDEALCEFADHLFLDGEDLSFGQKLQAAIEYERPEYAREGRLALPRFKRAMKGWRRLNPQQTRLPMPEFLKSATSAVMLQKGWKEEALFNETTFSTYARPGETLRVMAEDIVEKNADFDHTMIVLGPLERGESSKVGIYDETLVLDDSRAPWLGMLLVRLAKFKLQQEGEEAELWNFEAETYRAKWREAVSLLGIGEIAVNPYQNRHGGASRDHMMKLRPIPNIQRRGRWATDSSTRVYDKPGRMQQIVNQFGDDFKELGNEMQLRFDIYFQNGTRALPRNLKRQLNQICEGRS